MTKNRHTPSPRKPVGILAILALVALWAAIVSESAAFIDGWPTGFQILFYLVTGLIWIFPLKPLLRWMETGRFRAE